MNMGKLWTDDETEPFMTPWRRAVVTEVVDGDSFRLRADLGFDVDVRLYTRLLAEGVLTTPDNKADDAVNAWETRGVERVAGLLAEARAKELLPVGSTVRVWSFKSGKTEKYGRFLVVLLYKVDGGWQSLGDILVAEGHARYATY
jgi:endonuclease YncB( thermonuclease family)